MEVSLTHVKAVVSILCFIVFFNLFGACSKKDDPVPPPPPPDATKEITSFTLIQAGSIPLNPNDISVVFKNDSILVGVPVGIDLTQLKPNIAFKGVTLMPSGGDVQNFSAPVTYTVTAEDGSTRKYVVVVVHMPLRNRVFIGGDNNFYALDAETGALQWQFQASGPFFYSNPTFKDSIVYVGGGEQYVYAFHATTGKVLWKFKAGQTGVLCSVTTSGNTLYIGNDDHEFYALDAQTGSVKWKYTVGAEVSTTSTVVNGIVYFGCVDKNVYALDAATGNLVWKYATGAPINESGPAVANGILYIGSNDFYLYAIDAATGALIWKYNTGVALLFSSPTIVNGMVYIAGWYNLPNNSKKGSVYAMNAATGTLVWEALANTGFSSSPLVSAGMLYISAVDGNFYALNASAGSVAWSKPIKPGISSAAIANGLVFVGGGGTGYIYAYNATSGLEKWKYAVPNLSFAGPLVLDSLGVAHYSSVSGMVQ
jgi:outer membrane protein assembly factor BamB